MLCSAQSLKILFCFEPGEKLLSPLYINIFQKLITESHTCQLTFSFYNSRLRIKLKIKILSTGVKIYWKKNLRYNRISRSHFNHKSCSHFCQLNIPTIGLVMLVRFCGSYLWTLLARKKIYIGNNVPIRFQQSTNSTKSTAKCLVSNHSSQQVLVSWSGNSKPVRVQQKHPPYNPIIRSVFKVDTPLFRAYPRSTSKHRCWGHFDVKGLIGSGFLWINIPAQFHFSCLFSHVKCFLCSL